jgi:ATP-dependent Lon protease
MGRKHDNDMNEFDQTFPIVPLRDVVIFPSMATAILVGRQPSVNAVERAISSDKLLLVITQKNPTENDPSPEDMYMVGTIVRIGLFFRLPDGTIKLMLEGISRVRVKEYLEDQNFMAARVDPVEINDSMTREIEALTRKVETLFTDYVRMNHRIPNEVLLSLQTIEDRSTLADTVAAQLIVRNDVKQRILETDNLEERFMTLSRVLSEELEILEVEKDIDEKVSSQVQRSQKELFLHEKMKAIRDELGHGDEMAQFQEIKRRIRKARMSRTAQKIAYKELDRLKMMSPMTPEATVVRNYLDTLTGLPWKTKTKDNLDLEEVKKKLDADHYGLTKVKERVIEFLAVVKLVGKLKGPILCFVGPPGVGKTSLGRSIADAVDRKFVRISLGGTRDEAEIRGHRRTYIGSMPGRIIQGLKTAGTRNPVFLLDEIDKLSSDFRGDPSSALL